MPQWVEWSIIPHWPLGHPQYCTPSDAFPVSIVEEKLKLAYISRDFAATLRVSLSRRSFANHEEASLLDAAPTPPPPCFGVCGVSRQRVECCRCDGAHQSQPHARPNSQLAQPQFAGGNARESLRFYAASNAFSRLRVYVFFCFYEAPGDVTVKARTSLSGQRSPTRCEFPQGRCH